MPEKYEREIEEILSRLDVEPPRRHLTPVPTLERTQPPGPPRWRPRWRLHLTPSTLIMTALALAVLGYPLQWVYPRAAGPVALLAAALLIGSLVLALVRWRGRRPVKTWRDRPIDVGGPSAVDMTGLVRRWRRWRARRRFRDAGWR